MWAVGMSIQILISIIIIYILHSLFQYFKDTYTTKKTKDLVGFHTQKYKAMLDEAQEYNNKQKEENQIQRQEATAKHLVIDHSSESLSADEDLENFLNLELLAGNP